MKRRIFVLASLLALAGCRSKSTENKPFAVILNNPNGLEEIQKAEQEIIMELRLKLKEKKWKLEECSNNLFCGLPNLEGTKLYWHKDSDGFYFFIRNYKDIETTDNGVKRTRLVNDNEKDKFEIRSKSYIMIKNNASQLYINLAHSFIPTVK